MPSLMGKGLPTVIAWTHERTLQSLAIGNGLLMTCGVHFRMGLLHMSLEASRIRHPLSAQAAMLHEFFPEVSLITQTVQ